MEPRCARAIVSVFFLLTAIGFAAEKPIDIVAPPSPESDPFVGTWRLDVKKSNIEHNHIRDETRTYARAGNSVHVTWVELATDGKDEGEYTTPCDGKLRKIGKAGTLACWYTSANSVTGETGRPNAPHKQYYRRVVSPDGKTLTLTWYHDESRTSVFETRVFHRQ